MVAALAGSLKHVVVLVVAFGDELFEHFARIQKRFYELLSHWRSPLNCSSILG
jgi:ATP-dependent protease HslVU (ClpYQ) peptidase subunit